MKKKGVQILYKDDVLIAVSKPYGMIVNNADTSQYSYTLQDWVKEKAESGELRMESVFGSEFEDRSGIVHRLDKETSGVLLIARSVEGFVKLQSQFKERIVKKVYVALCHGEFPESGSVSVPVGRLPWNRKRFGVVPEGREAETSFELISRFENPDDRKETLSFVRAFPKTGRTHQIRVHLQYAGFPIYADLFYTGRKVAARDRKRLSRHFLHAEKISFSHPKTQEEIVITAPLPDDLSEFIKKLKKRA